jgi:1,4-alpha-glucan branching enzyme
MQTIRKQQRSLDPNAAKPAGKTPVEFVLETPGAQSVTVAGDFNNWEPARTPLRKTGRGVWRAELPLTAGRYEYRFVVDGQWLTDPAARESTPNPFGGQNSIKVVKPPVASISPLLLAAPTTFKRMAVVSR